MGKIVDSIFGGGGGGNTTVQQTAQNTTEFTVTNQVANIIDITALAHAMETLGGLVTASGEKTQALIAQLGQAQIFTALADAQERARQNNILTRALDMTKIAALAVAGYFIWRKFL